jgi:hypothetical protein
LDEEGAGIQEERKLAFKPIKHRARVSLLAGWESQISVDSCTKQFLSRQDVVNSGVIVGNLFAPVD